MSASLYGLVPGFRPWARKLLAEASRRGYSPRVTSTRRSNREQNFLYRQALAGLNPFPVAPPGQSAHQAGYALDMVTNPFNALHVMGKLWRSWGGIWGASDPVHFEFPGFLGHATARARGTRRRQPARTRQRTRAAAEPVPQRAASSFAWRVAKTVASFAVPTALATKEVPCTRMLDANDWRCRHNFFDIFCCP